MKKRETRKLTLARETLLRLEEETLVAAGIGVRTDQDSICFCITDLCISAGYTGCSECNCS